MPSPRPEPARATTPAGANALRWVLPAAVFAAAFVAFIPALSAGFSNFDDPGVILEVDGYRGLSSDHLAWMFTTTHMGHYHPLTWVSYAVDFSVWGLNPVGYHLSNVLLHGANALLVYALALRLIGRGAATNPARFGAAVAAVLFAVHPLRVESVAWITERRDVLSTLFLLLTTLAYLRCARETARAPRARWYAICIALLLCSLLSKAWGMSFFVVALVLDWYPLGRLSSWRARQWGPVLLEKLPFVVLGLVFAAQAARAQASAPQAVYSLERWGVAARLAQAAHGLVFYVWKLVWPADLAALYELPPKFEPSDPRWIVGALGALALAGGAVALRRRLPAVTAAIVVYSVLLSPVLGLLQSGIQLVADRYSYVANIPWAVLLGAGVAWLAQRGAKDLYRAALAGAAVAMVGLGTLSWVQCGYWRDTERLFVHALEVGQDGPNLREYYGRQLLMRGAREEALRQFEAATQIDPTYGEAWFSSANVLRALGTFEEADRRYLKAAALMPDGWRADVMRGVMYHDSLKPPRLPETKVAFEAAIAKVETPGGRVAGRPYMAMAQLLHEMGDEPGSRRMLEKAARFGDTRAEALEHLQDPRP